MVSSWMAAYLRKNSLTNRGDVEEALDLVGVQVHGQHPVGAGAGDQVGHQLGGNGVAGLGLPVLAGVAEIGDHRSDPPGGGALQGVDHDEQLHEGVVDSVGHSVLLKGAGGLNHKHVRAADGLIDGGVVLAVGEGAHLRVAQRDAQLLADGLGQLRVGIAGKNFDAFPVCDHTQLPSVIASASGDRAPSFSFLCSAGVFIRPNMEPQKRGGYLASFLARWAAAQPGFATCRARAMAKASGSTS